MKTKVLTSLLAVIALLAVEFSAQAGNYTTIDVRQPLKIAAIEKKGSTDTVIFSNNGDDKPAKQKQQRRTRKKKKK